ncbi:MAG: leucyl aminopeptidase [Candidatus Woesearchaeota archaeon]
MKVHIAQGNPRGQEEALVIGIYEDDNKYITDIDEQLDKLITHMKESKAFLGEKDTSLVIPTLGKLQPKFLVLVGLGKNKEITILDAKRAFGLGARAARDAGFKRAVFDGLLGIHEHLDMPVPQLMEAAVIGVEQGVYKYDSFKTTDKDKKKELNEAIFLFHEITEELKQGFDSGKKISDSILLARNLVNGAPSEYTPMRLAEEAKKALKDSKVKITVFDSNELKKQGMNGILAVGAGSMEPPCMVVMDYKGKDETPLVIVGKGITFDSGGLDIKPWQYMDTMQSDMSGAAAVIGAMKAITALGLKRHVIGIFASAENMPGNKAFKQGDIIKTFNGKTIEIRHTDAEGRVVLADALAYADSLRPSLIVDIATLTGACVDALGTRMSGLFTEDDSIALRIQIAASLAGEPVWRLPLNEEFKKMVKADTADVRNTAKTSQPSGEAGASTAAAFLSNFVQFPWAHIDIGGTAYSVGHPVLKDSLNAYGATGVGVQLFVELARLKD